MDKEKKKTRNERAFETKRKLFETAYELFGKNGPEKTSVDMITQSAGVSKGTFYVHFLSKNELISEMIILKLKEVDMEYEELVNSAQNKTSTEQLLILTEKIMDTMVLTIGYEHIRIMYEGLLQKNNNRFFFASDDRKLFELILKIIENGIKTNEFEINISTDKIVNHIIIMWRGLVYEWCILYPEFGLSKTAKEQMTIFLKGLKSH